MGFRLHWLASAAACRSGRAAKTLALAAAAAVAAGTAAALTSPAPLTPAPTKTLLFSAPGHSSTTATSDPATPPPATSPWVILGSIPRVAELEGGADVSLALAAPPRVSRLAVSPRVFPARITPRRFPFVLAADASSGLLLLSAILDAPPARVDVARPDGSGFVCWRDDDPRYFVLDAATGAARRLPDPAPHDPVAHQALLGLLACPGSGSGGGRYVVAELVPLIGGDTATLRCYYSDAGAWVAKRVRYPLPPRLLAPARTLALHGRLWWADYSWGVLTADLFADKPVLGFVPLPRQCVLPSGEALGVLDKFRYVGVSAGSLRFVDTYRRGGGLPNKVTIWTLPDRDATEWVLEHEATFAEIWADDTYKVTGLPKKPPVLALIHPHDPAVVYFFLEDHLFAVDVPAHKVLDCQRYHLVAPPRDYVANRFVRAWELSPAVSSGPGNWSSDIGLAEPAEAALPSWLIRDGSPFGVFEAV